MENRDFTLDELIFMQGHLCSMGENLKNRLDFEIVYDGKDMKSIKKRIKTIEEINKKISELFKTY